MIESSVNLERSKTNLLRIGLVKWIESSVNLERSKTVRAHGEP